MSETFGMVQAVGTTLEMVTALLVSTRLEIVAGGLEVTVMALEAVATLPTVAAVLEATTVLVARSEMVGVSHGSGSGLEIITAGFWGWTQ